MLAADGRVQDIVFKEYPISAEAVAPLIVTTEAAGFDPPSVGRSPEAFGAARCYCL
jgi:hypothetical protein